MFKLESYLTPLILNYVDKYIKNLKPEDSQFSIWGGDAVFCNLDLRLEVLEQELQLPFTFVNGHIHELRIHVPWTKLGSEPVIITINTIECILKLSGDDSGSESDSQKIIKSKRSYNSHEKSEITEAPPGYIQSLINRVISNICIVCNNLILKYVEDDVVLSLNIKSVELLNVNDRWEKAFVDPNITDTIIRKVIHTQDLTVCLDKRDASGKIETYQDPLLYRCSTTWRLYSVYNSPLSKYPILTRIHMYCENVEFSLTDQQLPMFLRLLYLCVALHNRSTFKDRERCNNSDENAEFQDKPEEISDSQDLKSYDESWGSWAWSFIPEVPTWNTTTIEEQEKVSNVLLAKKIFQFGIFVGKASCTLKQTIIGQDSIFCGSSKCTFVPLMVSHFYGCSMEFTCKGKDFLNVQAGVTGVILTGLEDCVCGHQDFTNNDNDRKIFLKSGVPPSSGHIYSYLSSSLFDPLASENCGQSRKYNFNHDEHFNSLTEEVMVQRFPAFAFDYLYELEIPDEWQDRISSITTVFLEESNWHESSICRLVFGPLCIDITSSFVHRLSKLLLSVQEYDYPCYAQSRKLPTQSNNVDETVIEELEDVGYPSRQYHLTFFKPVIHVFSADHSNNAKGEAKKGKKKKVKTFKMSKGKEPEIVLEIYAECIDLQAIAPMYPSRLVAIANNHPTQMLLHHCYTSNSIKLFGLEISLQRQDQVKLPDPIVIEHASITLFMKSLMLPEVWTSHNDLIRKEYSFECTNISLKLCEIRFLALITIYQSWMIKHLSPVGLQSLKAAMLSPQAGTQQIYGEIHDIKCTFLQSIDLSCFRASVASVFIKFQNEGKLCVLFQAPEFTQNIHAGFNEQHIDNSDNIKPQNFFQCIMQIVPEVQDSKTPPFFILRISGSTFCLEPALLSWFTMILLPNLNFSINFDSEVLQAASTEFESGSTCSSVTQDASVSQTLTKSQSTAFASYSDYEFHKKVENMLFEHSKILSNLILDVEIGTLCGLLPHLPWSLNHSNGETILHSWKNAAKNGFLNQDLVLCFPMVKIRNNSSVDTFHEDLLQFDIPIKRIVEEKKSQDCFPWNLQIDCFTIYSLGKKDSRVQINYLLHPSSISATIALSIKSNQNQIGLCVHMDSKFFGITLSAHQSSLLVDCLESFSVLFNIAGKLKSWISNFNLRHPELTDSCTMNPDVCILENIYDIPINDVSLANKHPENIDSNKCGSQKLTLWSQFTLSKLSVILLGKLLPESEYENFKVHFEAEEIISSLDMQDVYSKIKVKLTSLSGNCFTNRFQKQDWNIGPYDGIVLFCNDAIPKTKSASSINAHNGQHSHAKSNNQPFLVATYTKALCDSVKEKWTSQQNFKEQFERLKYISEIDVKVKSFDLILWMSLFDVTYQIFFPIINHYKSSYNPLSISSQSVYPAGINFCSQNLPLLYVETNIIQLYLPENSVLVQNSILPDNERNIETLIENSSVLLFQVDCVTLTSQVENPLSRIILDAELYNAALKSKCLLLPGAAIEDRQYQMDINGIALGSVLGRNILCTKNPMKDLVLSHPLTMGENPALEWNIGVIPKSRNIANDSVIIIPIISPLNIRVVVAPAIVCINSSEKNQTKVVVAGISSEVSVNTDISVYLSSDQLCFMYSLIETNMKFLFNILYPDETNVTVSDNIHHLDVLERKTIDDFPFIVPSCFTHTSNNSCIKVHKVDKSNHYNFIPFEILVTAGTVSVMFYYHTYEDISGISSNKLYNEESFEAQYFKMDPGKNQQKYAKYLRRKYSKNCDLNLEKQFTDCNKFSKPCQVHPFLCISITEPHSYIMCRPQSQKFESSCFDLQLHGSAPDNIVQKPHELCMPVEEDFSLSYLETKPGEPKLKTGIPPSLFTISCADFLDYPANVEVCIERPMKFYLRPEIIDSTVNFIHHFQSSLEDIQMKLNDETDKNLLMPDKNLSMHNSPDKVNLLKYIKSVSLNSTQVVLEVMSLLDDCCNKLVLTSELLGMDIGIEIYKGELKCYDLNMNMTGFTFQMCSANQIWSFLQPLTFALHMRYHLNPWFQIELQLVTESLLFNLSFHKILKLKKIVIAIQEQFQSQLENFMSVIADYKTPEVFNENSLNIEMKKRKYWNDDLRKGSFQFTQACKDQDSQPKALEIIFNRATPNHPASMTWCYPEPRAITKIEVSPVPFQCEEGKCLKDRQVLTCYLQYWNPAQQEYLNVSDFMLSETEHCCLDLPDLNSDSLTVSDKWRVLLDCRNYIDDDGILEIENPCLSPLALAACMSIDSCFDPYLIPVIQIQASFELFRVSLYNYFDNTGCTPYLHPFEFDDASPQNQEFAQFSFINPSFLCTKWTSKLKLSFFSGITCEILEYQNLAMLPVISPVDIHCKALINFENEMGPVLDMDLVLHPCFFRINQSVIHTLAFSVYSVSKDFINAKCNLSCTEYILPNYYLICNNIHESIRLGQVDTDECIILSPLKAHAYSWWCQRKEQLLHVSFGSSCWKWSQPFSINKIGKQIISIANFSIIIRVKKFSTLQNQVIIDGQLIVHNQLSFPLQLKCDFKISSSSKTVGSNMFVIKSVASKSSTPGFLLSAEQCKTFKLYFTGIMDSQSWSEEISFNDKKVIKISWRETFQNVWCQVFHKQLDSNLYFISVFICPLYVLRNNLPISLNVNVIPKQSNGNYSVKLNGKGNIIHLHESVESDHELQVMLGSYPEFKISPSSINISLSDLSGICLQGFSDIENVEELSSEMQSLQEKLWPYSFLDRVSDNTTYKDTFYPCFDVQNDFLPAVAATEVCPILKVEHSQCWIGLNTILLDLKPHAILVNRLTAKLSLFNKSGLEWVLPSKSVAIPSTIHEMFFLEIEVDEVCFQSFPLCIKETTTEPNCSRMSDAFHFSLGSFVPLPLNGSINVLLKEEANSCRVCLIKLMCEFHNNIIIITALPITSILNKSGNEMTFTLSLVSSNEKEVNFPSEFSNTTTVINSERSQSLLVWTAISSEIFKASMEIEFEYYIHISIYKSPKQIWSLPLCLHSLLCDNSRNTLYLPTMCNSKYTTLPVVICSHKWEGMLLLVVDNDSVPALHLHNQTNMNIFYGQSIPVTEGKFVYEELKKYNAVPMLYPDSSAHYTFPAMQDKFPTIIDKIPMLCLGLKTENDNKYVWSTPFKVNLDKQFVHILGVCDFMIHCKQIGHTVNLYVDPVNRIEITAKEIRSRIALATDSNVTTSIQNSTDSVATKSYFNKKLIPTTSKSKPLHSKIITKELYNKLPFILYINARIVHASFIICDELKEKNKSFEVFRLNIDNAIFFSRPKNEDIYQLQEIYLCFEHIQLDNQMDKENNVIYDFPVIMQRQVSNEQNSGTHESDIYLPNKIKENSIFILNATIELPLFYSNKITVQSLNISLLPISICIEDTFYYAILNLTKSYTPMKFHRHNSLWCNIHFPKNVIDMSLTFLNPVHFQELKINIPEITLSVHASLKLYLSLENSVLKFQPFEKENIFSSSHEIGRAFVLHYLTGALFRAGWVVGSLDLLGNPAGFARAVGAGMSDFVYLPYKGFLRGPRAFISGLSSGATSLFTQISSGAITCMASLASSISRNMDFLCLDNEHLVRQEHLRHHLPQGISDGLIQGLSGFGLSLLSAVAGIADHPLQALICPTTPIKTASDVARGFGKGIVGVFTKPIGGAAQLLSQTGYGLLHGAGWLTPTKRQYQPISISLDMISSNRLKYEYKITQCATLGEILISLEATYIHENGDYEKNMLVLTSEALCIFAEDGITFQRSFALSEIRCKRAESDQSTLVVIPSAMYKKRVFLESGGAVDRVVEYIIKNREGNSYIPQDDFSEFLSKSTSSCHIFYLYPRDRSLFLTLFSFAKNKAMGKGFYC